MLICCRESHWNGLFGKAFLGAWHWRGRLQGASGTAPYNRLCKHKLQPCLCGPLSLLKQGFTASWLLLP